MKYRLYEYYAPLEDDTVVAAYDDWETAAQALRMFTQTPAMMPGFEYYIEEGTDYE